MGILSLYYTYFESVTIFQVKNCIVNYCFFVGSKQAAFLHALSSAALVYEVTRGCTTDKTCECGRAPSRSLIRQHARKHPGKKYRYGGCHDNIAYGMRFSRDFLDTREVKVTKHADKKIVNLHNNDLGRRVRIIFSNLYTT